MLKVKKDHKIYNMRKISATEFYIQSFCINSHILVEYQNRYSGSEVHEVFLEKMLRRLGF